MNEGGITPVMSMNPGYGSGFGFGNEGIWLFAILALMWGGGGLFIRHTVPQVPQLLFLVAHFLALP